MSKLDKYSELNEVEGVLGIEPTTFKTIDDEKLSNDWLRFKRERLDDGDFPEKYCDLIAVAVAAASGRTHSVNLHEAHARSAGASASDIKVALSIARFLGSGSDFVEESVEEYDPSQDAQLKKEVAAGW